MNPFTTTLKITPACSKQFVVVLSIITLVAIVVLAMTPMGVLLKSAGFVVILVWYALTVREHCLHQGRVAIRTAILRTDDSWLVLFESEDPVKAELLPDCLVQPWLTVLQFKIPNRRRKSLILLRDNVDVDTFRRLRVRLKNSS